MANIKQNEILLAVLFFKFFFCVLKIPVVACGILIGFLWGLHLNFFSAIKRVHEEYHLGNNKDCHFGEAFQDQTFFGREIIVVLPQHRKNVLYF